MDNLLQYLLFDDDDGGNMLAVAGVVIENLALAGNIENDIYIPNGNEGYFENIIPTYTLDEFKTHFRMSRPCFEELSLRLAGYLKSKTLAPIEKKILFTLWQLAKPESFLAASDRFGITKSTGRFIFLECVEAICHLKEQLINWPSLAECTRTATFIETQSGIPGVIGSIDETHIPIKQPVNNAVDFRNREDQHSVTLQAVCNEKKVFIDVFVSMAGTEHEASVFRDSPLFTRLTNDPLLLPPNQHILGDASYPLMTNLIKPYGDNGHLTQRQRLFNKRLSSQRAAIDMAYGLLKGKWRRLKCLDMSLIEKIPEVVCACCILHNFLLKKYPNDYDNSEMHEDENYDGNNSNNNDNNEPDDRKERYGSGAVKRDYLATLLK